MACADALQQQMSESTWKSFFQDIQADSYTGDQLVLAVPNALVKERIEARHLGVLRDAVAGITGGGVAVELLVRTVAQDNFDDSDIPVTSGDTYFEAISGRRWSAARPEPRASASGGRDGIRLPLNPKYTFDTFVIGASNRFAHAAALSVAETPARSYNPLFIHGEAGLGKTHLLHAIGHYVGEHYGTKTVRYVSTETFTNEFIDAVRTNTKPEFKRRYRECDVLLVDDIQFLENKEATQEEFFHTFNTIHGAGGQIVITSDRHAKSLATLEERLRSRFMCGLITDVQPPDLETRLAILRKKADSDGGTIPDEVLDFIAVHIKNNIRELEGALLRVSAYASLNHEPATRDLAERILADIVTSDQPRTITPQVILEATAETFGFDVDELCGASRRRPLVTARQIGMYVFRELTDYSYPAIGRQFGGRDHTTVMHAVEKISGQMKERRQIYNQVSELMHRIKKGV
ncbi:MAG: chromosomal replication initiator protein DnaA [Actinobacteria bacterium]|nr:chromosomal replication initiator protein DnaA [Actinomycetota bacterium]MBW3649905.1 chromosomal replication initiator protein DnaA [Actinomycetota bacterium]